MFPPGMRAPKPRQHQAIEFVHQVRMARDYVDEFAGIVLQVVQAAVAARFGRLRFVSVSALAASGAEDVLPFWRADVSFFILQILAEYMTPPVVHPPAF